VPTFADDLASLTAPRQSIQRQLTESTYDLEPVDAVTLPELDPVAPTIARDEDP